MHRNKLISDLAAYGRRHPQEAAVLDRFLGFVRSHESCFHRDCRPGHVTASAWLLDPGRRRVLLNHHRKLNRWLQPGGHCDGDPATLDVAVREAMEETGLEVEPWSPQPLDIDIHAIPAREDEPAHRHYDLRYALVAKSEDFAVSDESHALVWAPLDELRAYTSEASVLRLLAKWRGVSSFLHQGS